MFFWSFHSMTNFNMVIKSTEFQWFWCTHSMSDFNMCIKPMEFQWFWCVSQSANEPMSQSANLPTSQIGIQWSGTKKCSQRYEVDQFFLRIFAGIQPSECFRDPVRESSVLPIQYPIGGWGQGSKRPENGPNRYRNAELLMLIGDRIKCFIRSQAGRVEFIQKPMTPSWSLRNYRN